jgi:hypothetical protein
MEAVTMPKEDYDQLVRKAEITDDALVQFKLSLEDMRNKRVSKF